MIYVIWTARLAVFAYLLAIGFRLTGRFRLTTQIVWTLGFLIFCGHVLAAFQFVHDWSHAAAWRHTAEQTKALTGWFWGGGIWFNYLFLVLWGLDVLLGWRQLRSHEDRGRFTKLERAIRIYLAFIVLNATVVFGPIWWWPVMIGCVTAFVIEQRLLVNLSD